MSFEKYDILFVYFTSTDASVL